MTEINRRNFLFGTVASVGAGTALVLAAPKEAVKLFEPTLRETVALSRMPAGFRMPLTDETKWYPAGPGNTLFNSEGVPVAIIHEINMHRDAMDVTPWGSSTRHLEPGLITIDIRARGITPLRRERA